MKLRSYAAGAWYEAPDGFAEVASAVDGRPVALVSSQGVDFQRVLDHARKVGGPALRALTFHQRADLIKRLATHLNDRKEPFYELAFDTGATRKDNFVDIDGGIMTLFAFASKARRELPDACVAVDGALEPLSKGGTFAARHIMTPLRGAAVHINAYNFPTWGMLEKLAPAIIAGVPVIVKPATQTAYVAHAVFEEIVASGILPEGSVQFIAGGLGDLLDRLTGQDVVSFTGSAQTAGKLQRTPAILTNSVRFIAEQDSLNAAILGPDVGVDAPEFELFVKEVAREITTKAGQRCTCIRRAIVPRGMMERVQGALAARLDRAVLGNPRNDGVTIGALVSRGQRDDVLAAVAQLAQEAQIVYGDPGAAPSITDGDATSGAFMAPVVLRCDRPLTSGSAYTASKRSGRSRHSWPMTRSTRRSRSPIAAKAAWSRQSFRTMHRRPMRSCSGSPRSTVACWSSIAMTQRNRPAMERRSRRWCTADPVVPAGAKRWAASAASSTICNARPCKGRRNGSRR